MPLADRMSRLMSVRTLLFALKIGNLGVNTVYQFALIYVLIRTVGAGLYPWLIFMTAVGNYVLSADLGFSGYVYADVRRHFIAGRLSERLGFISHAMSVYAVIALGSAAVAAVGIALLPGIDPQTKGGLALYFLSTVLGLPWTLLRRVATAIDRFVAIEVVEFVRRVAMLGLAGAMLGGLGFAGFAAASVAAWIAAFAVSLALVAGQQVRLRRAGPRALIAYLVENRAGVFLTGSMTSLEFAIYNFPYLLIPVMFGSAAPLVAWDLFYKVCRFGGVAFAVPLETQLPYQTRAYHAGDPQAVVRFQRQAILLCLAPFAVASVLLIAVGQPLFDRLLNHAVVLDPELRWAMVAMMGAILFQAAAGTFLTAVGEFGRITRMAVRAVAGMAVLAVATTVFRLSFVQFLAGYVAIYALYTIGYQLAFRAVIRHAATATPGVPGTAA